MNIVDNAIFRALATARRWLDDLYAGRINGMILFGPPGIGKTVLSLTVAEERGIPICAPRPGSARGLLQCLYDHRDVPLIVFDDLDGVWSDEPALNTLKVAIDSKSQRMLSHSVGVGDRDFHSILPFDLKSRVLFLSNKDFNDQRQFSKKMWESGVQPIKNRCPVIGIPFDPAALYEYVGWLAVDGAMLRNLFFDYPIGVPMPTKDGGTVIAHEGNRRRVLGRQEQQDVLDHFYRYALQYPSISPRELARFAMARIGKTNSDWQAQIAPLLTGNWNLPAERHRFSVIPSVSPDDQVRARVQQIKANIAASPAD